METTLIILILVSTFALPLIGYVTRILFEKSQLNVVKKELHHTLGRVSAKDAELAQAHAALDELNEKQCAHNSIATALLIASTHGILAIDSHNCIHHFNKHFCNMWDLSEEKIHVGMLAYPILQHCMKKTVEPEIFLLNHLNVNHLQDRIWSADIYLSNKKIFQSSSSPILGLNGTFYGRILEFIDVTECVGNQKRFSGAYRTSWRRLLCTIQGAF